MKKSIQLINQEEIQKNMMNSNDLKRDYIKTLTDVKLVIGNGFDLHCKLCSSYYHYYLFNKKKFDFAKKWYLQYEEEDRLDKKFKEINIDFDNDYLNIWDFFFGFEFSRFERNLKEFDWFNIERMILDSLRSENTISTAVKWEVVRKIYLSGGFDSDTYCSAMANIIYKKRNGSIFKNDDDYYSYLINELRLFEKKFGKFILNTYKNTMHNWFSMGLENEKYYTCTEATLNDLCNVNNLVAIDSFNYSTFRVKNGVEINHINGDVQAPIFGIDTIFKPTESKYIFTKTCRRIEAEMLINSSKKNVNFKNIIVYGHSLNEADYNYFFATFDSMNLIETSSKGIVVFAYSIYNNERKYGILKKKRNEISLLFYHYGLYKNLSKPERLLELLSFQNKIVMYEIPELVEYQYNYDTYFEIKEK